MAMTPNPAAMSMAMMTAQTVMAVIFVLIEYMDKTFFKSG
jgi:hypothetical protein